jgi:predicted RNase H-like HicB family nuclease
MPTQSPVRVRVKGQVPWGILQAKGGNWVAICEPLKITLQAETWANLMEDIAFALDAMFKELLSSNELNRFMKDHGWKLIDQIPRYRADLRFDLPFIPAIINPHGSERSLRQ